MLLPRLRLRPLLCLSLLLCESSQAQSFQQAADSTSSLDHRNLQKATDDTDEDRNTHTSEEAGTFSFNRIVEIVDDDLDISHFDVEQFLNDCRDLRDDCSIWATAGKCHLDSIWMHAHCAVSCQVCHERLVIQNSPPAEATIPATIPAQTPPAPQPPLPLTSGNNNATLPLTTFGVYDVHAKQIWYNAIRDERLGSRSVPQRVVSGYEDAIRNRIVEAAEYMQDEVYIQERYRIVRDACQALHADCAFRAATTDDCDDEATEDWMLQHCSPLCFSCDYLHVEARCPIDPNEKHAWYPGDLNKMFETIVSDPAYTSLYNVTILSRPKDDATVAATSGPTMPPTASNSAKTGPWVIVLDNFLTEDEATTLIALGAAVGYERSTDVGVVEGDGSFERVVSTGRTSTNAWCNTDECQNDPTTIAVYNRMEQMTHIPVSNFESFQLLRYEPGQFYERHHDYIDYEVTRQQGVRILTIFLYLNNVTQGGETDFPDLALTVTPKVGRALLWPSVLDHDPNAPDWKTQHQALPVQKGIKYGANVWLHQRKITDDCD